MIIYDSLQIFIIKCLRVTWSFYNLLSICIVMKVDIYIYRYAPKGDMKISCCHKVHRVQNANLCYEDRLTEGRPEREGQKRG